MKNRLLPLFFVLGSLGAYSQVGIGTVSPNLSSQLEIFANDKGVLIPRVALKSSTDTSTIANGNVNSLMVFNTNTISDITPGYYYWYDNKWLRVATSDQVSQVPGTVTFNSTTNQFTYTDAGGNIQILDIEKIIKANETVTTLVKDPANNGKYVYTSEDNTKTTIDVVGDVIDNASTIFNNLDVTKIIQKISENTTGNVTFNSTTNEFSYIDASGVTHVINISELIQANETVTTLVKDPANNGKYIYTSEDNTKTTIDVVGDVTTNFSTIVNNTDVTNILRQIIKTSSGNVTFNGDTNEFSYIDASGVTHVINISELIQANETVTTLVKDPADNGKYTYTNESAAVTNIDVVQDIADNFNEMLDRKSTNEGNRAYDSLAAIIKAEQTMTEFTADFDDNGKRALKYTNEGGKTQAIPVSSFETETDMLDDETGKFIYVNETGVRTTIDIPEQVATHFTDILAKKNDASGDTVQEILTVLIKQMQTLTTLDVDNDNNLVYKDEWGNPNVIKIADLLAGSEKATTLVHDVAGKKLTYTGEQNTVNINLKDITTTTSDKVLAVTGTGATFTDATVDIVPSTVQGDVLTTTATGVAWQAPAKSNVMDIKVINNDYTLTPTDYTIIARNLTSDITITLPKAEDSKGRILVINQFNAFKAGTTTPVVVKFNTDVIYSDSTKLPSLTANINGGSGGSMKITLQSDGTNWYVITYTM
ncbi:hypothetical protein [Flavobacterium sp. KJJ]|uniref:hypothetical protein n=1 Tax=Flavobacterium sp. KJJ TaxID=1270193 RepID=UPI00068C007C|nr:hypothetical protein [Flavobacterium sp. KJJ]